VSFWFGPGPRLGKFNGRYASEKKRCVLSHHGKVICHSFLLVAARLQKTRQDKTRQGKTRQRANGFNVHRLRLRACPEPVLANPISFHQNETPEGAFSIKRTTAAPWPNRMTARAFSAARPAKNASFPHVCPEPVLVKRSSVEHQSKRVQNTRVRTAPLRDQRHRLSFLRLLLGQQRAHPCCLGSCGVPLHLRGHTPHPLESTF
jgi:hypothetical protein